ncbi:hypothetical protein DHEL01_v204552 [Diaporthe helianthi]|uniref:Uncharacterized protein n=1 Tax=Diaporthe helianthi TaxID=158607 RepID=A0A2P5I3G0_DIAHE|nr:hypothetical protein DHEL01_v204552 [Diaporthe helianthi]
MAAAQRSHGLALGEDFRLVSDPENSPRGFLEAHGGAELSHSEHVPYDISTAAHMSKPAGHVVFDRSGSSKSGAAVVQGIHSAGSSPMPVVSTNLVQAGPSAGRLSFIRCQFSHTLSRDGAGLRNHRLHARPGNKQPGAKAKQASGANAADVKASRRQQGCIRDNVFNW